MNFYKEFENISLQNSLIEDLIKNDNYIFKVINENKNDNELFLKLQEQLKRNTELRRLIISNTNYYDDERRFFKTNDDDERRL